MKTMNGFKRVKKATIDNYLKAAKEQERRILSGKLTGLALRKAKKRYQFCMWKAKSLGKSNLRQADKLAQMLLPYFLKQEKVVKIDELFLDRTLKSISKSVAKRRRTA